LSMPARFGVQRVLSVGRGLMNSRMTVRGPVWHHGDFEDSPNKFNAWTHEDGWWRKGSLLDCFAFLDRC
jgi:hypothetical protein